MIGRLLDMHTSHHKNIPIENRWRHQANSLYLIRIVWCELVWFASILHRFHWPTTAECWKIQNNRITFRPRLEVNWIICSHCVRCYAVLCVDSLTIYLSSYGMFSFMKKKTFLNFSFLTSIAICCDTIILALASSTLVITSFNHRIDTMITFHNCFFCLSLKLDSLLHCCVFNTHTRTHCLRNKIRIIASYLPVCMWEMKNWENLWFVFVALAGWELPCNC